ncbi:MAG: hypothetical protein Tsb0020_13280 [Haliangiales bacterium]
MQTIAQAFEIFFPRLELTDAERDKASDQHRYLREQLQQRMSVQDNFLSGSYARKTAVRPLNDIDVFLVLAPTDALHQNTAPAHVLVEVTRALETIYDGKTARKQARSVNIEFSGTGIAYDVVPAFATDHDHYVIPDAEAAAWISTNPKRHREMATEANERAGKKLKPLFKAIKQANNCRPDRARSFHLEVLSWEALSHPPATYMDGLVTLLDYLAMHICKPCADPAGLGGDIRPSLERCQLAATWLNNLAHSAREASQLASDGRTGEAHRLLHEILGDLWPEKGSAASRKASPAVTSPAVDDSRSRFG